MHRVVGLPGESVELKNHRILINKVQLEDDWAIKIRHYNRGKFAQKGSPSVIVPQDSYYILGDNSARSQDSRFWGCLARSDLIGKVFKRYFPLHRSGTIE
jgi:signal peptidase I